MTFPISYFDIPSSSNFPFYKPQNEMSRGRGPQKPVKNYDYTDYAEGLNVGYRYFVSNNVPVAYPFGFGLSYTTFEYSKPKVTAKKDGTFEFQITVKNTGKVAGKEAVQAYVSAPAGGLEKPVRELKAFAKTRTLAPGESETLTMKVTEYDLASFNDVTSAWETAKGSYKVLFGASVEDIRCEAQFSIAKNLSWSAGRVALPQE